ncbi:MAG: hypothetical protein LAN18_08325 [Acidobacteriia bacterium]|nr:hypothetical protein [Terriglobia bacterium]
MKTGFVFLLAALAFAAPLILVASRRKSARTFATGLILAASIAGCIVAAIGFWRQFGLFVDFSRVTPFPFTLGVDRLSAFFFLLICAIASPVAIYAASYFDRGVFFMVCSIDDCGGDRIYWFCISCGLGVDDARLRRANSDGGRLD